MIPAVIALGPFFLSGAVVAWVVVLVAVRFTLAWASRREAALDGTWTTDLMDQAVVWGLIAGKGYSVLGSVLARNGLLSSLLTAPLSTVGGVGGVVLVVVWQGFHHRASPATTVATGRIWLVVLTALSSLGLIIEALQVAAPSLVWSVVLGAVAGSTLLIVGWTRQWTLRALAIGAALVIGITQLANAKASPVPIFAWSGLHVAEAVLAAAGWLAWGASIRQRGLEQPPDPRTDPRS